ncbi:MAG TPA: hypothetical protein VF610_00195 [Segetibacter sp.]
MDKHKYKLEKQLDDRKHNMLIHGFLMAIQHYVKEFPLISTATYIIKKSSFYEDDLLRCQLESGYNNDLMIPMIKKAFSKEEEAKPATMNRNTVTTLDKLVDGDRFYKLGSKKKQVMAVLEVKSVAYTTMIGSVKICPSEYYSTGLNATAVKNPKDYEVVFLRHEIDIA